MIQTQLTTKEKGTVIQEGTSGFTVTCTRSGEDIDTRIEYSQAPLPEMREMVAALLTLLDEMAGEAFIASCFARYAQETNKHFFSEGDGHALVIIRGEGQDAPAK